MILNLEQTRARNAIKAAGDPNYIGKEGGRAIVKKVPALIRGNGFLGALAFAIEDGKGHKAVFEAVLRHLKDAECDFGLPCGGGLQAFFDGLAKSDGATLRAVTAESMAFLAYLRRFAKP